VDTTLCESFSFLHPAVLDLFPKSESLDSSARNW